MTKILVIDDKSNVRALLDLYLRYQGYNVILADDGWKGSTCITKNSLMSFFFT
jgi:DNA-binding response OmpR family regulator